MEIIWSDLLYPKLNSINLELTSFCNYRCKFCINANNQFRKKGNISDYLVEKIIDELDNNICIHVCGIGEPSLYPSFVDIINKIINKFCKVSIVTNGYLFRNKYLINSVLHPHIEKINVSIDYFKHSDYYNIKGGNLEEILLYIKDFIYERRLSKYKPLLQINYLYESGKNDYIDYFSFF